tara:strand:- start:266 stop:397 length:132 start_codon:yes stop_codon:yes gene_type:complete
MALSQLNLVAVVEVLLVLEETLLELQEAVQVALEQQHQLLVHQ